MPDFGSRWEWIEDFREGGQAHTFKVKDRNASDEKIYILKRLKNPKRGNRFDREIQACRSLDHPNVMKIEDSGVLPGKEARAFFVSEYCDRGSLEDQKMPPGSLIEAVELFRQICAGVAHAHDKGVIHRDIKPENILIRANGTPVVSDFGICYVDADDTGRLTATMEVAGSRWYCAPELRDGRLESGISQAPADVYSLGKLLYWMVSGKKIFDREDFRQQKYRIGQDDPREPSYELINQLFDRTIVHQAESRIQNARALVAEVDQLISVMNAGGHAISLEVPHRCLFCAQGEYKVVVNGLQDGDAQRASGEAQSLLGWAAPGPYPGWLIMVCQTCGNVQVFRPDLPPAGSSGFVNQLAKARKQRWLAKRNP